MRGSSVGFAHVAAQKLRTVKACTELMSKLKAKHKALKASGKVAAAAKIASEYKAAKKQKQALEDLQREHSSKQSAAEALAVAHGQRNAKVLQKRLARRRAAAADQIAFHSQDHFVANLKKLTTVEQCDALLRKLKKKHKLLKGESGQADAVALVASHYAACQDHRRALFAHPEYGLDDRIRALAAAGDAARERKGAAVAKADAPSAVSTRRDVAQYVRLQGTVTRLKALHAARKREGDDAGKKQAAKAYNAAIKQKKALKVKLAHVPRLKQLMGDATRQLADAAAAAAARKAAAEAEDEEASSSSEEEDGVAQSAASDDEGAAAAAAAATRRAADAGAPNARPRAASVDSEEDDPPPPPSDSDEADDNVIVAARSECSFIYRYIYANHAHNLTRSP